MNKIGQIALQGRKYGIGFLIIAQRTANVSKTVLTQCNSIICFQAFDETSYRFLENHLGVQMVKALPRLPKYHAIAVGKAFRSNIPMIVDLTRPLPEFDEQAP
ncbi:ATP-binding protein [bacterium]|nr:ATP-binding protein [bacterium]